MVRRSDDTWCLAEVIHRRENQDTDQEEFYVHYENFNRYRYTDIEHYRQYGLVGFSDFFWCQCNACIGMKAVLWICIGFDADPDPDPTFHFVVDPDPTFHFDADPDPDPAFHFDAVRIRFLPQVLHMWENQNFKNSAFYVVMSSRQRPQCHNFHCFGQYRYTVLKNSLKRYVSFTLG
jgi:hypothetical protein